LLARECYARIEETKTEIKKAANAAVKKIDASNKVKK
jgi:hypothetical protein